MPAVLVNYNYDPTWLKDHKDLEVTIYDRSDDGVERNLQQYGKVYKTPNIGNVDYDKLNYLIENYDNLPEVFVWGKTNLSKYVSEDIISKISLYSDFTPLLTLNHTIYSDRFSAVNKYIGGIYAERADSWYFHAGLDSSGRFTSWQDWANTFHLPKLDYVPFAPGGNYILTRDKVHKYSRDFYEEMRDTLPYARNPVEAHCAERSYYLLWK